MKFKELRKGSIGIIIIIFVVQSVPYVGVASQAAASSYAVASYDATASIALPPLHNQIWSVKAAAPATIEGGSGRRSGHSYKSSCYRTTHIFIVHMTDWDMEAQDRVGITGELDALGRWRLENAIELHDKGGAWTASIVMPCCVNKKYRYFIYVNDAQGRKQVRYWESLPRPRLAFGNCNGITTFVDHFGDTWGNDSVSEKVNRGWITNESILQLKIQRDEVFRVHDIEKFYPQDLYIIQVTTKCNQIIVDYSEFSGNPGVQTDVAKLKYGESRLKFQRKTGVLYNRGDIILFHTTLPYLRDYCHHLLFYNSIHQLIGTTKILPTDLIGSEGELNLQILSVAVYDKRIAQKQILAELILPYQIIRPYHDAQQFDFRTSYANYWPKTWPNIDIGHRGMGRSFRNHPAPDPENTVASFFRAYDNFADMIELDVHLTMDGVPIVYHDFGILTAPRGQPISSSNQLEFVLIKDVTYEQLKNMRLFAVINNAVVEFPSHNAEPRREYRFFPTLQDVLVHLPKSLGIDVEIKWPQRTACGGVEAPQTIDKNYFVDRILDDVFAYGCDRPLFFSSFDADICAMLRFKQNMFSVVFLTQGETKKWEPYLDLRTRNFIQAVNTAESLDLAGTAPHAEDFINANGAELLRKGLDRGQMVVMWGDDCDSKERVAYFDAIGATATCYDRVDLNMKNGKTRSFFNTTEFVQEFRNQCQLRYV